jgi:hypothetical protein
VSNLYDFYAECHKNRCKDRYFGLAAASVSAKSVRGTDPMQGEVAPASA